ncbi:MAG: dTDP-4-dehydrorhamnose 3,5-epimerase family protein [Myxococcales bacterium]|nr:dTDP-4-dehydrorhamnose 3,5-epimerase family protein [Myxococcota bacterium]MDW8282298.1 dTDP-4-dehydrorhamnose 3,5-epimerase family protein [Myxococcales bacterium]
MKILSVTALPLPEVKVIRFARFCDHRGSFAEVWRRSDFQQHPDLAFLREVEFGQANESLSRPGTLRGLHFQWDPPMGKLVRTICGRMIDLVLDVRLGSPTFGHIVAHDMPAQPEQGEWIWVPPGFAHGNYFPSESIVEYFCTGHYNPECEASISPLSPDIHWDLCAPALRALIGEAAASALVSDRDRAGMSVSAWQADPRARHFVWQQT